MRAFFALLAMTLVGGVAGCGKSTGPKLSKVTGRILVNGQPLANAHVEFQPEKGSPSFADTAEDGTYSLRFTRRREGALAGRHQVRISTKGIIAQASGREIKVPEKLPPQYNTQSTLVREVPEGGSKIDFEFVVFDRIVRAN